MRLPDRILTLARRAGEGLLRAAGPSRSAAAVPTSEEVLTSETVASVRRTIRDHDGGQFARSAALAGHALRDADLLGAINQRVLGLLGCAVELHPAGDGREAQAMAEVARPRFGAVVPRAVACDMLTSAVLLGFAVGQLTWSWDEDLGELVPQLSQWPSSAVSFDPWARVWWAHTPTGLVPIVPGDGQWVLYTPRSQHRPYYYGALRAVAEWFLRSQYAAGDASRHSEIHGVPVWLAEMPAGQAETEDGRRFVQSVRNMGRNAVVPLPQGSEKSTSYGLRLEAAQTDAYRIFEFLLRTSGGKIRLAVLGQDLTSQNNQVGTNASSESGRSVAAEIRGADAVTFAECLHQQVLHPWAEYRSAATDAPTVHYDVLSLVDALGAAEAMTALGEAASLWTTLGLEVDLGELARRARVPVLAGAGGGGRGRRDPPGRFELGQDGADRLAERARVALSRGLDPMLDALTDAVNAAESPADLRRRLLEVFGGADAGRLAQVFARARVLARAMGRWSAVEE